MPRRPRGIAIASRRPRRARPDDQLAHRPAPTRRRRARVRLPAGRCGPAQPALGPLDRRLLCPARGRGRRPAPGRLPGPRQGRARLRRRARAAVRGIRRADHPRRVAPLLPRPRQLGAPTPRATGVAARGGLGPSGPDPAAGPGAQRRRPGRTAGGGRGPGAPGPDRLGQPPPAVPGRPGGRRRLVRRPARHPRGPTRAGGVALGAAGGGRPARRPLPRDPAAALCRGTHPGPDRRRDRREPDAGLPPADPDRRDIA